MHVIFHTPAIHLVLCMCMGHDPLNLVGGSTWMHGNLGDGKILSTHTVEQALAITDYPYPLIIDLQSLILLKASLYLDS